MAATQGALTAQILTDTNRDNIAIDPYYTYQGAPVPLYPAAIQRALVAAIKYMESRFFWMFRKSEDLTISEGTNTVDLPLDYLIMDTAQYYVGSVIYTRKTGFLPCSYEDLLNFFNSLDDTGLPKMWAIFKNTFNVYPYTNGDTLFTIWYYYKDITYPTIDGQISNDTTSIWYDDATVDLVRMKAMELFYRDTLQTPETAAIYTQQVLDFEKNLALKNQNQQMYNFLSI